MTMTTAKNLQHSEKSSKFKTKVESSIKIIKLIFQWKNRIYMMFMWLLKIDVVRVVNRFCFVKKFIDCNTNEKYIE